jgi:hypothetical protein
VSPEIPQIKLKVGTELITLNNQQVFHRNCAGCHDRPYLHPKGLLVVTALARTNVNASVLIEGFLIITLQASLIRVSV